MPGNGSRPRHRGIKACSGSVFQALGHRHLESAAVVVGLCDARRLLPRQSSSPWCGSNPAVERIQKRTSPRRHGEHSAAEPQPKCGTAILAVTDSRAGSPCHKNRRGLRRNWRIVVQRESTNDRSKSAIWQRVMPCAPNSSAALRDLRVSPETSRKLLIIRKGNGKFPALWTRQRRADTLW